jgi:hypothetical protein
MRVNEADWNGIMHVWRGLNAMGWYVTIYSGPNGVEDKVTIERIVDEIDVQRYTYSGDLNIAFIAVAKYAMAQEILKGQ